MTAAQYRDALSRLGLTQMAAARLLGIDDRTSRRWAQYGTHGPWVEGVTTTLRRAACCPAFSVYSNKHTG
jgi:hypothetical protein